METLKAGSKNSDVELAQAALNYHIGKGPKIKVDGKFGWETQNRVIGFQKYHGLVQDGVIGQKTRAKLFQAITVLFSGAILKRPSEQEMRLAANGPNQRFPNMPMAPFSKPIDWSKLNWRVVPLWPTPPIPQDPWPQLTLKFPPFPQMPGLPPPPSPPKLVLNTPIAPGSSVQLTPPVITPFDTPSADIFMIRASVLSRQKNLTVKGEIEPMLDDDGHTYKFQGTIKAQVDNIVDIGLGKIGAYINLEAEAGVVAPTAGKVTGSSGVKFTFLNGKVVLAAEATFLTIDGEKNRIDAGLSAFGMKATVLF